MFNLGWVLKTSDENEIEDAKSQTHKTEGEDQWETGSGTSDPFPGAAADVESDPDVEAAEIWGRIGRDMEKEEAERKWAELKSRSRI